MAESKTWSNFTFCNRLEAKIMLQSKGKAEPVEVGYLVAWMIHKDIKGKDSKACWIKTFLEGSPRGKLSELGGALKAVYDKDTGYANETVGALSGPLGGKIVFLDTLILYQDYHRCGIAQQAMDYFHKLLSTEADLGVDTVLLSPAACSDSDWAGLSEVEVEQKLVKMYQKEGYRVWLQGAEEVEGSATIMGKHLAG